MSYFSRLRTRQYTFDADIKKFSINEITDITNRGRIIQFFQKDRVYDIQYRVVEDGEKPETIAYKEYGDAQLHWVILLLNEVKNPQFEWPKSSVVLNEFVDEKYKGSSIFLNVFSGTETTSDCRCQTNYFPIGDYLISKDQEVILRSISGSDYTGKIVDYNPKIGELAVIFTTNNFSDNETTVELSDYTNVYLQTKNLNEEEVSVDIKPFTMKIYTKRKYSINHFRKNGSYIDFLTPISDVANDSYLEPSSVVDIGSGETSFFDPTEFCFSETILGTHLGCNQNQSIVDIDYIVTNQKYEFEQNENKRQILLPKKRTIKDLIKQFDSLFKGKS